MNGVDLGNHCRVPRSSPPALDANRPTTAYLPLRRLALSFAVESTSHRVVVEPSLTA